MNSPMKHVERFRSLTKQQVADALNISTRSLERLHKQNGGLPRFRVTARRWAYSVAALDEWQQQQLAAERNKQTA